MQSDKLLINTFDELATNSILPYSLHVCEIDSIAGTLTSLFRIVKHRMQRVKLYFLVCCRTDLNILIAPLVAMMSVKLSSVLDRSIFFGMMVTNFTVCYPNDEKKCCSSIFIAFVFTK